MKRASPCFPSVVKRMTAEEFRRAREALGFRSAYAFAGVIGITRQQAYKLESGQSAVTETTRRLIEMYRRHGVPGEFLT